MKAAPDPICSTLLDAEVYDDAETATLLNLVAEVCYRCETRSEPLVALIRFPALGNEMALCGECYRILAKLALGQVT